MANPLNPVELAARVRRDVERNVLRTRNGIKHLAGIDKVRVGQTPRDEVWAHEKVRLYRYRSEQRTASPPVLLVMSLVSKSYIFDLRPGSSFVEVLLGKGLDVFLLDWGIPDEQEAKNTFETYCDDYLNRAVDVVCDETDADSVTMLGYCLGGVLALLHVAGNPDSPVRNLACMATPVDYTKMGPMTALTSDGRLEIEDMIDETGNVPADSILNSFRMLKPTGDVAGYANLWQNMWNDEYMEAYQAMTGWSRDQIPFPGATMRQMIRWFNRDNALLNDTVRMGARKVSLRDITIPFLSVLAEKDHIAPPEAVSPLIDLVGSEDKTEMRLPAGHVGLMVGRAASKHTMPAIADWLVSRSEQLVGSR
jgi:polyhydroxyalkanoate synthase subunit PhaC